MFYDKAIDILANEYEIQNGYTRRSLNVCFRQRIWWAYLR